MRAFKSTQTEPVKPQRAVKHVFPNQKRFLENRNKDKMDAEDSDELALASNIRYQEKDYYALRAFIHVLDTQ